MPRRLRELRSTSTEFRASETPARPRKRGDRRIESAQISAGSHRQPQVLFRQPVGVKPGRALLPGLRP